MVPYQLDNNEFKFNKHTQEPKPHLYFETNIG